jgi:ribonuclease P protein component
MLSRKQSVNTELAKRIVKDGSVTHTRFFTIRAIPLDTPEGKAAISVSSKTEKLAVRRNLLKRRVSSMLKKHSLLIPNTALLISVKPNTTGLTFSELEQALVSAMEQARPKRAD